jgi:hypothetical protein
LTKWRRGRIGVGRTADQAASDTRSVDFSRAGFPPGGCHGEWSRLASASSISSMEAARRVPGMARKEGHDVTAAASDAQEARIALFSARDNGSCRNDSMAPLSEREGREEVAGDVMK